VRLPQNIADPIKAGPDGAVYLRFRSLVSQGDRDNWKEVEEISFRTLLRLPNGRKWMPSWEKYVHKPPRGCSSDDFEPDLWNLTGIAFEWFKEDTRFAHFQFWACKKDVNCGVHNHEEETFLETHLGLSPGTGSGVTRRVKDDVSVERCKPNDVDGNDSNFDPRLHLDVYEQQGGFWRRNEDGTPMRREDRTVDYPYHGWKGGSEEGLDIWCAVEYNPDVMYP
jgi:hypothetical protein